jgi:hypothetical protein
MWYFAATHDGGSKLRMRIMSKKLESVFDAFNVRKALWKIDNYGVR